MRTIIVIFSLLLLGNCESPKNPKKQLAYPLRQTFRFPAYDIQYPKSVERTTLWKVDSIMPYYPFVIRTKYTFQDTILHLSHENHRLMPVENSFSMRESISEFEEQEVKDSDSLIVWADYAQNIVARDYRNRSCYPVYVINNQKVPKLFTGKDSYVFAIQEALHPNGK